MRIEALLESDNRIVRAAAPFIHTEVGITNRANYSEGAILRGVDPYMPGTPVTDIAATLRAHDMLPARTRSGLPALVVGESLATRASVLPGDTLVVISFQNAKVSPVGGLMPTMRQFEVTGTFRTGMYEYDNSYVFTSVAAAQDLANLGNAVTGLEVKTRDRWMARASNSLPVPFSPVINTRPSLGATRSIACFSCAIAFDRPSIS